MEFHLIQTPAEFNDLGEAWNTLLFESVSHLPFLRHEYLQIWWETLGGGEWQSADLAIVTAHQEETLVGIAPLFLSKNRDGVPAYLLLGSIEVSDYLDVIVRPENLDAFLEGLLKFLTGDGMPQFEVLDFYNLLENSPTLASLERVAQDQGWDFQMERLQHSPYIPLPGDWDTYLAGIDKKQRHEIRRKIRRVENAEVPVRWYFVTDGNELEQETEAFMALMAQDPEKAAFLTEPMRRHMGATVRCAFDEGCLQLAFLEINQEKAAGYINFDYRDRIWVYNSGLDGRFREYSPGWVLLGYLLQWANENKRQEFDFMRGDEDYKYRFGAVDRFVMRAVLRRP